MTCFPQYGQVQTRLKSALEYADSPQCGQMAEGKEHHSPNRFSLVFLWSAIPHEMFVSESFYSFYYTLYQNEK
jgi:hypothetical protein